jgi:hypothetical protein
LDPGGDELLERVRAKRLIAQLDARQSAQEG